MVIVMTCVGVMLLLAAVVDIRTREVPLVLIGAGFMMTIILLYLFGDVGVIDAACGGLSGGMLVLVSILSRGKIGMGDALLFIVTGTVIGAVGNLVLMWAVFIAAGVFGTVRAVVGRGSMHDELPLVPFIFAGWILESLTKVFL